MRSSGASEDGPDPRVGRPRPTPPIVAARTRRIPRAGHRFGQRSVAAEGHRRARVGEILTRCGASGGMCSGPATTKFDFQFPPQGGEWRAARGRHPQRAAAMRRWLSVLVCVSEIKTKAATSLLCVGSVLTGRRSGGVKPDYKLALSVRNNRLCASFCRSIASSARYVFDTRRVVLTRARWRIAGALGSGLARA